MLKNNPLISMGEQARSSSRVLANILSSQKNQALQEISNLLRQETDSLLLANEKDITAAKEAGMNVAMLDRLIINQERLEEMAKGVEAVKALPDPIGLTLSGTTRPNGLDIVKKTVPLGVIGIIYESRPNVTIDSAVLCLKSGNATILRGGSEALHTNTAFSQLIGRALDAAGLPPHCVQLIESADRAYSTALMQLTGYVDALIPRGGQGLIQSVVKNATVPVIETGAGLCHLYIHKDYDEEMALAILDNAKTSRPSVCNAVETLLVHEAVAPQFLPKVAALFKDRVELRGCEKALPYLQGAGIPATPEDWSTEYNDYILAIRVVEDITEAMDHISQYSTQHSEAIVTTDYQASQLFTQKVDAAAVYVNASIRFTDGGEFGLGAEIGISTQRLHVRGPMGLDALTSYKYVVRGNGQIR